MGALRCLSNAWPANLRRSTSAAFTLARYVHLLEGSEAEARPVASPEQSPWERLASLSVWAVTHPEAHVDGRAAAKSRESVRSGSRRDDYATANSFLLVVEHAPAKQRLCGYVFCVETLESTADSR